MVHTVPPSKTPYGAPIHPVIFPSNRVSDLFPLMQQMSTAGFPFIECMLSVAMTLICVLTVALYADLQGRRSHHTDLRGSTRVQTADVETQMEAPASAPEAPVSAPAAAPLYDMSDMTLYVNTRSGVFHTRPSCCVRKVGAPPPPPYVACGNCFRHELS